MTDNLNLHLWVARRAEQGTLQAHADYVVENINLLEQAVKYEADLAQQALDSRAELAAEVKKYHDAWLEAEAQVVELEAQVEGCLAVIATERDEVLALRRKLARAMKGLGDSQEEIDQYIRQEYPSDHSLHERYRQRDFSANPARLALVELSSDSCDITKGEQDD